MNSDFSNRLTDTNQPKSTVSGAIINLHGYVIGANAVVWPSLIVAYISIGGALPLLVIIRSTVSAITVGFWRIYVQYLDNQIDSMYPELVFFETSLSNTTRLTRIRTHLVNNCKTLLQIFKSNLNPEQQAQIMEI